MIAINSLSNRNYMKVNVKDKIDSHSMLNMFRVTCKTVLHIYCAPIL